MEARSQKGTTYNIVKGGREIKPKMGEISNSKKLFKSFKNWKKWAYWDDMADWTDSADWTD